MLSLLTFGLLFGCPKDRTGTSATQDIMKSVEEIDSLILKMNEVERRITKIETVTKARGQDQILKLETLDEVRVEMANMRGDMEQLQFQITQLNSSVTTQQEDAQFRLDWLEQRALQLESSLGMTASAPGQEGTASTQTSSPLTQPTSTQAKQSLPSDVQAESQDVNSLEKPEPVQVTAQDLLKLAKGHLVAGREEAAEVVLNRILKEFPRSEYEPEVRYRLAEAAFNNKQYPESARRFQDVLNRHPSSPFASWSLLRQGECFEAMGQAENAAIFYNDVVSEYPKSKAAKEAKQKLNP